MLCVCVCRVSRFLGWGLWMNDFSLFRNLINPLCSPVMRCLCIVLKNQSRGFILNVRKYHMQSATFFILCNEEHRESEPNRTFCLWSKAQNEVFGMKGDLALSLFSNFVLSSYYVLSIVLGNMQGAPCVPSKNSQSSVRTRWTKALQSSRGVKTEPRRAGQMQRWHGGLCYLSRRGGRVIEQE